MIEAECAQFFRWLPWRKRVEKQEDELRWKIYSDRFVYLPRFARLISPGAFVLVNKDFFE